MNIGTLIYTYLKCKQIGLDQFGNKYYITKKIENGKIKRSVIYNGKTEASKIPPLWNAWLRYNIDEIPSENLYSWQKPFKPNLTGTNFAYHPHKNNHSQGKYQPWQP